MNSRERIKEFITTNFDIVFDEEISEYSNLFQLGQCTKASLYQAGRIIFGDITFFLLLLLLSRLLRLGALSTGFLGSLFRFLVGNLWCLCLWLDSSVFFCGIFEALEFLAVAFRRNGSNLDH